MKSSALAFHDLSSLLDRRDDILDFGRVPSLQSNNSILTDGLTQRNEARRVKRARIVSYDEAAQQTVPLHRSPHYPNLSSQACSARDAAMALYQAVSNSANARESEIPKSLIGSATLTHKRLNSLVSPQSSYWSATTKEKRKSTMTFTTRYLLTNFPPTTPTTEEEKDSTSSGEDSKTESESSDVSQMRKSFAHATILSVLPSTNNDAPCDEDVPAIDR